jgi:hypothetical protein
MGVKSLLRRFLPIYTDRHASIRTLEERSARRLAQAPELGFGLGCLIAWFYNPRCLEEGFLGRQPP